MKSIASGLMMLIGLMSVLTLKAQVSTADICYGEVPSSLISDSVVTGGVGPYEYLWQSSQDNIIWVSAVGDNDSVSYDPVMALTDTAYFRRIVIDQSCGDTAYSNVISIRVRDTMILSGMITDVSCNGGSDGMIDVTVTGGSMPYSYTWNNGASTQSISSLMPGSYTLTVTDDNGCMQVGSYQVTEPLTLVSSVVVDSNTSCNGASDGGATASATGGTMPYTYNWSNAAISTSITGAAAGTYSVTVTDANGCTDSSSVIITEPMVLSVDTLSISNALCNSDANGQITVQGMGGTTPYAYAWDNGQVGAIATNLIAGTYTVTITDVNGCTGVNSFAVTEPQVLSAATAVDSNASCNGAADGGVTVGVAGGTMPYSYDWDNGDTTASITGLGAGTYQVTVTDNNGCTITTSETVTQPAAIIITLGSDTTNCTSDTTGVAYITSITAGVSPFSVVWNTGAMGDTLFNVPQGMYIATLTDANGCMAVDSAEVIDRDSIELTLITTDATCIGGEDGSIEATAIGSNGGYSYNWSNGDTTAIINLLSEGTYTVTVNDVFNCEAETQAIITYTNELPVVDLGPDQTIGAPQEITLTTGADGEHLWSTGATTDTLSFLLTSDTTISVVVVSTQGCANTDTINISAVLGIADNIPGADIQLYPNPTDDRLTIQLEGVEANEVRVQVLDYSGQLVEEQHWENIPQRHQAELRLGSYAQGMYFINIIIDNNRYTQHVTVY